MQYLCKNPYFHVKFFFSSDDSSKVNLLGKVNLCILKKKWKNRRKIRHGVRIFIFHFNLNKCDTCTYSVGFEYITCTSSKLDACSMFSFCLFIAFFCFDTYVSQGIKVSVIKIINHLLLKCADLEEVRCLLHESLLV